MTLVHLPEIGIRGNTHFPFSEPARQNGVTEVELIEAITHLAFYSGWPNSVSAVTVAREVFKQS